MPLRIAFNVSFYQWGEFFTETHDHFVDDGHVYNYVDMDDLYNQQEDTFSKLLLSEYLTDEVYLIKGQMLPSYIFKYAQFDKASLVYANTVPQWSPFRNVFSEFVNSFVTGLTLKPKSYVVGTVGVATLKNSEGKLVELYLDVVGSTVPVPKWIWFTFEGSFTIYGYNNPYYEDSEVEAEFNTMCVVPISTEKFKDMWVGICAGDPYVEP